MATANAIRWCGATPAFVDIDPETYCLDPGALESALRDGEHLDAVVPVHLFGLPAAMPRIAELAAEHEFAVIEDAAQAHGAAVDGESVGRFGDAAAFSFFPSKNMTTGEGGMVVTDDEAIADRARRFIRHGDAELLGHNFCLSDIAAAVGRAQLEKLPSFTDARRKNARRLDERLAGVVETPTEPAGRRHVYHQYTVECGDRDGLRRHLRDRGIETGVYYETPLHRRPAMDGAVIAGADEALPTTEQAAERVLSLPVHPGLSADDVAELADAVANYVERTT